MQKSFFHKYLSEYLDSVSSSIKKFFPVQGSQHRLELVDVTPKIDRDLYDYNAQRETKLSNRTWDIPIIATVVLKDKSGKVLDKQRLTIARVPIMTPRFTYLVDGTEYVVPSQLRLRPGVYHEVKADNTIQANLNQINLRGHGLKIILNPKDFSVLLEYKTIHIPLIPLLLRLGVPEDRLRKIVGNKIFEANYKKTLNFGKLFNALGYESLPKDPAAEFVRLLHTTTLDPRTTKYTLNKEYDHVNVEVLVKSLSRLVDILRGGPQDDRDSLLFKKYVSPHQILDERLQRMVVLRNRLKNNVDRFKKISEFGLNNFFTPALRSFFTSTQISGVETATGPLSFLSGIGKATLMGEGGIGDIHRVTDKQRLINPSTFLFLDPVHTPDNARIGTTMHFTVGKFDTETGDLLVTVLDKKKNPVAISQEEAWNSKIGIQDLGKGRVVALHRGKTRVVPKSQVDYYTRPTALFGFLTSLIPFPEFDAGNRALMAAKQIEQSLPLKEKEAPLVIPTSDGESLAKMYVEFSGIFQNRSPVNGVVVKATDEEIVIKDSKGKRHKISVPHQYPLQDGFITGQPLVKKGDKVKQGQLIFDTNFTKNGELCFGKNLLVAYLPFKGLNMDDAVVISESAAKKLTSEHLYHYEVPIDKDTQLSKKKFIALYPGTFTKDQLEKVDEDGVVKKGTVVEEGDPLVLVLHRELPTPDEFLLMKFSRKLAMPFKDRSLVWENDVPGKVVRVVKRRGFVKVFVQTEEPARLGDKLANRHGNKGVIGLIVPDSEMPRTKDGKVVDVVLNPLGVISRMNMGQVMETVAGKVSEKTGKPYKVDSFDPDTLKKLKQEMKKLKISDTEDLIDPVTGKVLKDVFIGPQYIMKLKHRAAPKLHARGAGAGEVYNYDGLPIGGSEGGAQSLGHLGIYAMLAHGATGNLYETQTYKSDYNPDFWYAFQSGLPLPKPKIPTTYEKFKSYLNALGVDIEKVGDVLQLVPLTDEDILKLSNGKVDPTKIIRMKKGEPVPINGGLFDEILTGGFMGNKYTHIPLNEAVPNPLFERALCIILGINAATFKKLMTGELGVDEKGNITPDGKYKLSEAWKKLLKNYDVDKELAKASQEIKTASVQQRSVLARKIKILRNLKKLGKDPYQVFVRKNVIVIPPFFRPLVQLKGGGGIATHDINELYRNIGMYNDKLKEVKGVLPFKDYAATYGKLYDAVKALELDGLETGVTRRAKSVMDLIIGPSPKLGYFQNALLKRRQDLSARGVAVPDPSLHLDEVGIPEDMAWKIYFPTIVRRLVLSGYKPAEARQKVEERDEVARKALEAEMSTRPVYLKRDPVLHKYGVMAFYPKIVRDKVIHMHPLVTSGFNLDFDGDSISLDTSILCSESPQISVYDGKNFPVGEKIKDNGRVEVYKPAKPINVLGYDPNSHKVRWFPVTEFSLHRDLVMYKVSTRHSSLFVSEDHSLYGIDDTLQLRKMTPAEAFGRLVPKPKRIEVDEIQKELYIDSLDITVPIDYDLGFFLGFFAAEGSLSSSDKHKSLCHITSANEKILEKIQNYLRDVFKLSCNFHIYRKRNIDFHDGKYLSVRMQFNDFGLAEFLRDTIGHPAPNKHLPPFFLNTPEEFRCGLLAGLLSGDGSVARSLAVIYVYTTSPVMASEISLLTLSLGVRSFVHKYAYPRTCCLPEERRKGRKLYHVSLSAIDVADNLKGKIITYNQRKDENLERIWNTNFGCKSRKRDIVPINKSLIREIKKHQSSLIKRPHKNYVTRYVANKIIETLGEETIKGMDFGDRWLQIVKNEDIWWDVITEVEKFPRIYTGYDLTVPESYTFLTSSGFIVWDTMAVFTPVTDDAVQEMQKMLPSSNLFSVSTAKVMWAPKQDIVIGLYLLTKQGKKTNKRFSSPRAALTAWEEGKIGPTDLIRVGGRTTTAGRLLVETAFPSGYRIDKALTAKDLKSILTSVAKNHPKEYPNVLDRLKEIGLKYSYLSGFSIGLKDLSLPEKLEKKRRQIYQHTVQRLRKAKTTAEKNRILGQFKESLKELVDELPDDNAYKIMVKSGARGGTSHLMQLLFGNVVQDMDGNYIEFPVLKGYAEGLDIPSYLTNLYGSRAGAVAKVKEVSEPGRLTKLVMNSVLDLRVTEDDCGTRRGVKMSIDDPEIIGRYLADDQRIGRQRFPRNTLVDQTLISLARKAKVKELLVRSPLTCEAVHGVCKKCLGLDVNGKEHKIGDFVGVKAAHAIGEPTTQLALNRWHVGTGNIGPFKKLEMLLEFPENIPKEAILSTTHGKVEKILHDPDLGGWKVIVSGKEHWVPADREVVVKKGQSVRKGDRLSSGNLNPARLLELKGLDETQKTLVNEIDSIMREETTVSKKNIELLVKALTNTAKVLERGSHPFYVEGDYAPISRLEHYNKKVGKKVKLPPHLAVGLELASPVAGFKAGTVIDEKVLKKIEKFPVIEVKAKPVKYVPVLRGVNTLPLDIMEDILAKLNFEKLRSSIIDAAAHGGSSWPTGPNPIPAMVTGMRIPQIPDIDILLQSLEFPRQIS